MIVYVLYYHEFLAEPMADVEIIGVYDNLEKCLDAKHKFIVENENENLDPLDVIYVRREVL